MADELIFQTIDDNDTVANRIRSEAAANLSDERATDAEDARIDIDSELQQLDSTIATIESLSMVNYPNDDVTTLPDLNAADGDISYWFDSSQGALQLLKFNASSNEWDNHGEPIATLNPQNIAVNSNYIRDFLSINGGISVTNRKLDKGLVTFIYDDTPAGAYDWVYPEMSSRGLVGCVAAQSDKFGNTSTKLTRAEMDELYNNGWGVVSHGTGNESGQFVSLSDAELESSLKDSRDQLESFGYKVRGLTYIGGGEDERVEKFVRKYYALADGRFGVNEQPFNMYTLKRWSMDSKTLSEIKAEVDKAVNNNGWIILFAHPGYSQYDDASNRQRLFDTFEYVKNYVNSGDLENVTYTEGMEKASNVLDIGHYPESGVSLGDKYLRIGADGSLESPDLGDLLLTPDINDYELSDSLGDLPRGQVSISDVTNVSGYPMNSGGTLFTYRPNHKESLYVYQEFIVRQTGKRWYREWDKANSQWGDFDLVSNNVDVAGANEYTKSNVPGDFDSDITYNYTTTTSPNSVLATFKLRDNIKHQIKYPLESSAVEIRYWDETNSVWTDFKLLSPVDEAGDNEYSESNVPGDFKLPVTYNYITRAGDNGLLATFKIYNDATRQFLYPRFSDQILTRYWDDATSQWSSWIQIAGGASGSFTASSGETVTVENGLITDIT